MFIWTDKSQEYALTISNDDEDWILLVKEREKLTLNLT